MNGSTAKNVATTASYSDEWSTEETRLDSTSYYIIRPACLDLTVRSCVSRRSPTETNCRRHDRSHRCYLGTRVLIALRRLRGNPLGHKQMSRGNHQIRNGLPPVARMLDLFDLDTGDFARWEDGRLESDEAPREKDRDDLYLWLCI